MQFYPQTATELLTLDSRCVQLFVGLVELQDCCMCLNPSETIRAEKTVSPAPLAMMTGELPDKVLGEGTKVEPGRGCHCQAHWQSFSPPLTGRVLGCWLEWTHQSRETGACFPPFPFEIDLRTVFSHHPSRRLYSASAHELDHPYPAGPRVRIDASLHFHLLMPLPILLPTAAWLLQVGDGPLSVARGHQHMPPQRHLRCMQGPAHLRIGVVIETVIGCLFRPGQ
ncbi:hypothetical protein V8F33_013292 [Rhypophila sp. PSN 637]